MRNLQPVTRGRNRRSASRSPKSRAKHTTADVERLARQAERYARMLAEQAGECDGEEAASVALLALARAVQRWKPGTARPWAYCRPFIRWRVLDWVKSERTRRGYVVCMPL